jgi:hypothetical protein
LDFSTLCRNLLIASQWADRFEGTRLPDVTDRPLAVFDRVACADLWMLCVAGGRLLKSTNDTPVPRQNFAHLQNE